MAQIPSMVAALGGKSLGLNVQSPRTSEGARKRWELCTTTRLEGR